MPGEHARLSPSGADRWFACPGAPDAEAGLPETESPAAAEGTAAHELLEQALTARTAPAQLEAATGSDSEMLGHVTAAWRVVAGLQHGSDRFSIETRTDPGALFGRDDLWGTADIAIEHGDHLTLLDFKYGRWPVEPEQNRQLQIYAIGAAAQALNRIETFTLGIIQPRTPGPILTSWRTDRAQLADFARELRDAAAATDAPDAPRVAGDHCVFCRARDICPARQVAG